MVVLLGFGEDRTGRPPTDWDDAQSVNGLRDYLRERITAEDIILRHGESEYFFKNKYGVR